LGSENKYLYRGRHLGEAGKSPYRAVRERRLKKYIGRGGR